MPAFCARSVVISSKREFPFQKGICRRRFASHRKTLFRENSGPRQAGPLFLLDRSGPKIYTATGFLRRVLTLLIDCRTLHPGSTR